MTVAHGNLMPPLEWDLVALRERIMRGWCKYALFEGESRAPLDFNYGIGHPDAVVRTCLSGGIFLAVTGENRRHRLKTAVLNEVIDTGWRAPGGHPVTIPGYNDAWDTEKRHVIALIDRAIARARRVTSERRAWRWPHAVTHNDDLEFTPAPIVRVLEPV